MLVLTIVYVYSIFRFHALHCFATTHILATVSTYKITTVYAVCLNNDIDNDNDNDNNNDKNNNVIITITITITITMGIYNAQTYPA